MLINVNVVEEFEYLGSTVMADFGLDREINARIRKASNSFRCLSRILWYQQRIKIGTKLRMFKAAILPTLCVCVCVMCGELCVMCGELCVDVCMCKHNCMHIFGVSAHCAVDKCVLDMLNTFTKHIVSGQVV